MDSVPGSLLLPVIALLLHACSSPLQQIDAWAKQEKLNKTIKSGTLFEHVLFFKPGRTTHKEILHVYIEGDGQPWLTPHRIALDPTPREPLMLNLMVMDDGSALYLGRPCYIGLSDSRNCQPWYWTSGRYSEEVVDSMQSVLEQYLSNTSYRELVFFGHSGGGTLAMLLAKRFSQTSTLLTIAGNIDINGWLKLHGYSVLDGLNPVNSLPLPVHIKQYHLMASDDTNIPPELTLRALKDEQNAQLIVLPNYSHDCCWQKIWTEVLRCVQEACGSCMAKSLSENRSQF